MTQTATDCDKVGQSETPLDKMNDEELMVAECGIAEDHPEYLIDYGYLEIKTKQAQLVPLQLNRVQKILHKTIKDLKDAGKPVRIWLLKFRQGGCSTYAESLIYAYASQKANLNALIMADQKEKSTHLFEMSKLFQERLQKTHPHLAPPIKRSNEKKLQWEERNSQIVITSAENLDAARAFTYQLVHLSEVAFFRDLGAVLKALLQAVPDGPETVVIGETTANGLGGDFFTEWKRAKTGKSDWTPIFLGWYMMDEYERSLEKDGGELYPLDGVTYDTDGGREDFLIEEKLLKKKHNLRDSQLNWRRWCIVNKCKGEVSTFRQEYPADDEEAFLVSGNCIFDKIRLKQQKLSCKPPIAIGNLVEMDGKALFRESELGHVRIHEWPKADEQYCIGGDSTRTLTGDPAAGVVLNKRTNKTAAIIHGHIDPDLFAVKLKHLGMYYNTALVGPENNDAGHTTCSKLYEIYGNVFVKTDNKGNIKEIGWRTKGAGEHCRDHMIAQLKEEIREEATDLMDEMLIDECLNFVEHDNGKIEAASGCNDDLVLARCIAGMLRILNPYVPKKSAWKTKYKDDRTRQGSHMAA